MNTSKSQQYLFRVDVKIVIDLFLLFFYFEQCQHAFVGKHLQQYTKPGGLAAWHKSTRGVWRKRAKEGKKKSQRMALKKNQKNR